MTEQKFTKGPWEWNWNLERDDPMLGNQDGACIIQSVWHNDSTTGLDVTEADARLMAAAPEMYEMLVEVLKGLRLSAGAPIRQQIVALIAKIDGRES